jgi:hypothetical protein
MRVGRDGVLHRTERYAFERCVGRGREQRIERIGSHVRFERGADLGSARGRSLGCGLWFHFDADVGSLGKRGGWQPIGIRVGLGRVGNDRKWIERVGRRLE